MNFINQFQTYSLPNLGWTRLPKPPITIEDRKIFGSNLNESNAKFLSRLVMLGFDDKLKRGQIPQEKVKDYLDRCQMELDTFDELHFTDYMLLVWKVIQKAKELGVFIDFGRGSVSGSCVSWFLGISGCDPIKYNLFFSRFLNKARAKSKKIGDDIWIDIGLALDIDINLGEGRDAIVQWLKEIYPNRICKVSNVSSLTGKVLIKDVYKTLEYASEEEAKEISDLVERRFGVVQDIEKTYKENDQFKKWADNHSNVYNIALRLRNLIRQTASHASGYLISFDELTEHTPLCLDSDKQVCSAYTMDDVQTLKLDLLGLETNLIIKNTLSNIPDQIDLDKLNLESDSLIYDQFQNGNLLPYGLYQIGGDCAYKVCNNIKPKNVMELSHVNAIARPVALAYEKPYIENKSKCPHPLFEEALKWTNYQPIYQEQTLMCLRAIGYSEIEAEQARRVFAKKKIHETEEQVKKVKEKIFEQKLPEEAGNVLIKLCQDGASYQFNLSHSLSTSYLTALTVYLKYKYPLQFYQACLNEAKNKGDFIARLGQIYNELSYFNIKLLPPHIVKSDIHFKSEGNDLRFSLSSIKGINAKSLVKLKQFQNQYSNKFDIFRAADLAGLNLSVVSALILVGSLDDMLTESRAKTQMEYVLWKLLDDKKGKEKSWASKLGPEYNFDLIEIVKALNEKIKDEKGKPIIKDSRRLTIRKNFDPYIEIYKYNKRNEDLSLYYFERSLLGFSYSTNLYDIFKSKIDGNLMNIYEVSGELQDNRVLFVAEVVEVKLGKSREKKIPYLKVDVKDHTGQLKVMIFETPRNQKITQMNEINGRDLKEGDVVVVSGSKKDGNTIFADKISLQKLDVFLRISQLPKKDKVEEIS